MDFTQPLERIQKLLLKLQNLIDYNDCILCQSYVESCSALRLICQTCYQDLIRYPLGYDILRDNPKLAANLVNSHYDGLIAISDYQWPVSHLIHQFKYRHHIYLSEPLATLLKEQVEQTLWSKLDFICPLPLHSKRYHKRGFNQAELIGRQLSRTLGIPQFTGLVRVKATQSQARLNKKQRQDNVKDAFDCAFDLTGKNLVLVDDVITTGSTLNQACRVLKQCGAARVYAAVAAIRPLT